MLGEQCEGYLLDCPLPDDGSPWPLAGIADFSLAQFAHLLGQGRLPSRQADGSAYQIPIARIDAIANVGPVHRLIGSPTKKPRGAFWIRARETAAPTWPVLWAHDAKRERRLLIKPDKEGQPAKSIEEAARIWATATRAHYNSDLRFNSQSLVVAMTEQECIGGTAWPSVIFENPDHEYAFALWSNSTLGLLLHWWVANKTQSGRGRTTVTGIPRIPTLDTRALTAEQHERAREAFRRLRGARFLPFDQIDEDEARARLDRALLVDVLGLPAALCEEGGALALLREKLAAEPQIHGGKKRRVVFTETGERAVKRGDR